MKESTKWLAVAVGVVALLGAGWYLIGRNVSEDTDTARTGEPLEDVPTAQPITEPDGSTTFSQHIDELEGEVNTLEYACAEGKSFMVRMETGEGSDEVEVFLNDGSKMLLTQTISASGIRFANAGESFVFWSKGDTAFIQEDETTSYDECVLLQEGQ